MTDIIVIGIIAICVIAVLFTYIRKVKRGEASGCASCGGNCSSKSCSDHEANKKEA